MHKQLSDWTDFFYLFFWYRYFYLPRVEPSVSPMNLFTRQNMIQFYHDEAEQVSLVIEDIPKILPMQNDRNGVWSVRFPKHAPRFQEMTYHFEVKHNGSTFKVADPLACRTERREHKIISKFSEPTYNWKNAKFKPTPQHKLVIYETHLPALSRHDSAPVSDQRHRGTYLGARSPAVLNHLNKLGVAVEFLPLHASDQLLGQDWGYFSTSFHAMASRYAIEKCNTTQEVKAVIDAMHGHGIPVLLDVVFNHGGELWARAWGEELVYRKNGNGDFCHGSGCGPTIRTEHPHIRATLLDALENLVSEYHIDGFRFDLGALHDKDTMLAIDRRLPKKIYLIAEPWALGGCQWGKHDLGGIFADTRWAVWNDDFRESGRTFILGKGDFHNRNLLMRSIVGSHRVDGGWTVRPQQSVNYLSSHDGNTLADIVGGDKKRQFLAMMLVLTSQGIPMLGEGSEMMFSKSNQENSYNRPDLNQLDWNLADKHKNLVEAAGHLIRLRKSLPHFSYNRHLRARHGNHADWDIDWIYPNGYPHNDNVNAIGYMLRPPKHWFCWQRDRRAVLIFLNGSKKAVNFHLPKGKWKIIVDGNGLVVNIKGIPKIAHAHDSFHTHPGTGIMLSRA